MADKPSFKHSDDVNPKTVNQLVGYLEDRIADLESRLSSIPSVERDQEEEGPQHGRDDDDQEREDNPDDN